MSNGYVVLFVKGKERLDKKTQEVLDSFREHKIKHKIVDLHEKIELYGNKVTLEGAFAIDFSNNGKVAVPITPLVAADDRFFYGSEEIKNNLKYLSANYPDTI